MCRAGWLLLFGLALWWSAAGAERARAADVRCCTILVDDGAEGYEVPGVQLDAMGDRRGARLTVRVARDTVMLRGRTSGRRFRNAASLGPGEGCAARSSRVAVCRMPRAWRARNANRRIELLGSPRADRFRVEPFARHFGAGVVMVGYRGNDTLVGGAGAAPEGWIALHASWRGFWGRDEVLLGADGPAVSPRLRAAGGSLLVDVGPSRRFAGARLKVDVASCTEWCDTLTTLARGHVILAPTHWTLARLPLTRAGAPIWREQRFDEIGIGFSSPAISATVWVHDLVE